MIHFTATLTMLALLASASAEAQTGHHARRISRRPARTGSELHG